MFREAVLGPLALFPSDSVCEGIETIKVDYALFLFDFK